VVSLLNLRMSEPPLIECSPLQYHARSIRRNDPKVRPVNPMDDQLEWRRMLLEGLDELVPGCTSLTPLGGGEEVCKVPSSHEEELATVSRGDDDALDLALCGENPGFDKVCRLERSVDLVTRFEVVASRSAGIGG
jgi:hypothetical protein